MSALKGLLGRLNQAAPAVVGLAAVGGAAYGLKEALYVVEGGHKAIIYSRLSGVQQESYTEGYHFKLPWLWQPVIYDCRQRPHEYNNEKTGTKDLQMVSLSIRVLCKPDEYKLPEIFRSWGPPAGSYDEQPYDKKVLDSVVQESLKANVARFNAAQLITERESVSRQIFNDLRERAKDFDIVVDDVSVTDLQFGRMYQASVEQKQVAQQMAQRASIEVERASQEKQQKIVEAQGETKSAELIGKAVATSPAYLNLEKIKAAREIALTVSQSANRVYLNANSLLLDVNEHSVESGDLSVKDSKKGSWFGGDRAESA